MTMKRNAECSLSERAMAFSVDALLSGTTGRSPKTQKTDEDDASFSSEVDEYGSKNESQHQRLKSEDLLCPLKEEEKQESIEVELQGADLWNQFYSLANEMIITKSGRRIFPALKVRVRGLDPKSHYIMWVDIIPVDNLRYRYVYHTSQWVVAGAGEEPTVVRPSIYIHPDSPSLGRQWQSQVVTFDKLKLTNNKNSVSKGQIILHSMHKYLPRIHVQKTAAPDCDPEQQIDTSQSVTFTFPETQFITVTAYQNQQITRLKIASNPFAKGFREVLKTGKKGSGSSSDRQKFEAALNNFSGSETVSLLSELSTASGIAHSGSMDVGMSHRSAFFPASTSLYHMGAPSFHYLPDNLRTAYSPFPLRVTSYDFRLFSPAFSTVDGYSHNTDSFPLKVTDSSSVPCQDSCLFRSDIDSDNATSPVFSWRPCREERKPTARVAPCVMHNSHSQTYPQISSAVTHQKII